MCWKEEEEYKNISNNNNNNNNNKVVPYILPLCNENLAKIETCNDQYNSV